MLVIHRAIYASKEWLFDVEALEKRKIVATESHRPTAAKIRNPKRTGIISRFATPVQKHDQHSIWCSAQPALSPNGVSTMGVDLMC